MGRKTTFPEQRMWRRKWQRFGPGLHDAAGRCILECGKARHVFSMKRGLSRELRAECPDKGELCFSSCLVSGSGVEHCSGEGLEGDLSPLMRSP